MKVSMENKGKTIFSIEHNQARMHIGSEANRGLVGNSDFFIFLPLYLTYYKTMIVGFCKLHVKSV